MARNKGGFVFASNFEVKLKEALDPRVVVSTKSDLISKETWPYDGDTVYLYNGLIVAVADSGTLFMLIDADNALTEDYSGWKQLDAAAAPEAIGVINSLESESTTDALAAKQGKVLYNMITTLEGKLTGIYSYKGSVDTYNELPADAVAGDVYNVVAAYNNNLAGTNYAWTGTSWDALGGSIDLSVYYDKSEVDEAISSAVEVETNRATTKENELNDLISANSTEIVTLKNNVSNNTTTISGISAQIGTINENVSANAQAIESLQESDAAQNEILDIIGVTSENASEFNGTLAETVISNNAAISQLNTTVSNHTVQLSSVGEDISNLEARLDTLEADASTEGSVDYKIDQALAWHEA